MEINFEPKRFNLSVTTYGIHTLYRKKLEEIILNEFGTRSTFIYEYLLDTPVLKGTPLTESISTFAPFLRRILSELTFTPLYNENLESSEKVEFVEQSYDNIVKFWTADNCSGASALLGETLLCKDIFQCWNDITVEANENRKLLEHYKEGLVIGNWQFDVEYIEKDYLEFVKNSSKNAKSCFLKEYYTVVYPWTVLPSNNKFNIGAISLSSDNLFYGVILVFYPDLNNIDPERGIFSKSIENNEKGDSQFLLELRSIIFDRFIPVLLLHENLWKEQEVSKILIKVKELHTQAEKEEYIEKLRKTISENECVFQYDRLKNSNSGLESSLAELWYEREKLIKETGNDILIKNLDILYESLIFSKYSIASLSLINEIKKIMVKRTSKKDISYLPSVLVIGSPGSGKDSMARAISLFFPNYRFGKRYTLNMASIKPSSISVPLMSGAELDFSEESNSKIEIEGIFKKIWKDYKSNFPQDRFGFLPVIILDELNSLDIDAQGALLRILENGKLQPLGGINEENVNFLVIGIVNEPEKVLTLHEPLQRFLTDNTVFGGVLGKVFYEYFRGMRRLREDIYFRMIREGKVELPNLAERRADIPMLFKVFLEKELDEEISKHKKLWIDYDVFDELMSESIAWNGNFRELQSLTKRIGQKAAEDRSNFNNLQEIKKEGNSSFYRISQIHVKAALEEMNKIK